MSSGNISDSEVISKISRWGGVWKTPPSAFRVNIFQCICEVSHLLLPYQTRGGGRLRGPDDQTHTCQSETTYFMMSKHGDF